MNKEQRKDWDTIVELSYLAIKEKQEIGYEHLYVAADQYIRKLERELQNIKQTKKIGAILKPLGGPR